jgi:ADP-ribose pyrophosphatase YjhB (NUDIX family)
MYNCNGFIILNKEKTKCLLIKANKWGFPKGRKKYNETDMECALRELEEETSLTENDIEMDENIGVLSDVSKKGKKHIGLFVAYSNKEKVKIQDMSELNEIGWFTFEESLKLLEETKSRKDLLEHVIRNLNKKFT